MDVKGSLIMDGNKESLFFKVYNARSTVSCVK